MAEAARMLDTPTGYREDFALWLREQAEHVRRGEWHLIDRENISEELDGLATRDEHEVMSRLEVIAEHLIKLRLSPAAPPRSGWSRTVREQRNRLSDVFEDSRSLTRFAARPATLEKVYRRGRENALEALAEHGEGNDDVLATLMGPFSFDELMSSQP